MITIYYNFFIKLCFQIFTPILWKNLKTVNYPNYLRHLHISSFYLSLNGKLPLILFASSSYSVSYFNSTQHHDHLKHAA